MCFRDWCRLQLFSDADLAAAIQANAAAEKMKGSKGKEKEKDI